jgi:hypothetical protein
MKGKWIKVILTGTLLLAAPGLAAAFTAANGTVTDERTGLVWQQQDDGQQRTWDAAISYCEGLIQPDNKSDWRLPNIKELESIIDDSRYNPSIDTEVFTGATASDYWSSTTYAGISSYAWFVNFSYGYINPYVNSNNCYVRCVRGGQ